MPPPSLPLSASLTHPFVPNGAVTFRFLRGLPAFGSGPRAEPNAAEWARATNQQNVFHHDRRRKREKNAASSAMRYRVDLDEYKTILSNDIPCITANEDTLWHKVAALNSFGAHLLRMGKQATPDRNVKRRMNRQD